MTMKSTKDMRTFLLDQMSAVAGGEVEVNTTKAVCNLAQQVYNTMNIEIKHAQAQAKLGESKIGEVKF